MDWFSFVTGGILGFLLGRYWKLLKRITNMIKKESSGQLNSESERRI